MQLVPESEPEPRYSYYLPHHGVLRKSGMMTKLRVVFNGSSRTDTGVSLNDLLHTGAKLQTDLPNVLIWFRQFRYVFSSDVEKMYRQIKVHQDDLNFQRILWRDHSSRTITYQLATVTYGLTCAPFLALRILEQFVHDEGQRFPLAVPVLTKGRYVDDVFGGAWLYSTNSRDCPAVKWYMHGGFPLRKWISNDLEVLRCITSEKRIEALTIPIEENSCIQVLGLSWNPTSNMFHFVINLPTTNILTKREILSTIAKLFDPLGLISPVIIKAKIFIQELWTIKLDWDDPLPPEVTAK